jgi:hypothetical protein
LVYTCTGGSGWEEEVEEMLCNKAFGDAGDMLESVRKYQRV